MKKLIKVILLIAVIFGIVTSTANAEAKNTWYIIKNGQTAPAFPPEADMVKKNDGYFIDESAQANEEKVIYLTFDAGYENGNIEKTLNILKEEKVNGAFFVLSNVICKNTDLIKRMFEEGHEVCNHTKNHKDMSTLTDDEMVKNLSALEDLCLSKTGYSMKKYFRFPEGRFDERTIKTACNAGYKTFFWSLAYADWDNNRQLSENAAIEKLVSNTHNGAIILLHPTSDTNVKILPKLISKWRDMGYRFGTLEELVEKNS